MPNEDLRWLYSVKQYMTENETYREEGKSHTQRHKTMDKNWLLKVWWRSMTLQFPRGQMKFLGIPKPGDDVGECPLQGVKEMSLLKQDIFRSPLLDLKAVGFIMRK